MDGPDTPLFPEEAPTGGGPDSIIHFERVAWDNGSIRVAGVDEAGRGPLAGPVVAGALVFQRSFLEREHDGILAGLDDSKKLSESRRESLYEMLQGRDEVSIGTGIIDAGAIDEMNILRATHAAMARALAALKPPADHALVDGLPVPGLPCDATAIVRGDSRSISISGASIVAKVVRDRMMRDLDRQYPEYGFAAHKGYGTRAHVKALLKHGPSPVHRQSFQPVRDAAGIQQRDLGLDGEA